MSFYVIFTECMIIFSILKNVSQLFLHVPIIPTIREQFPFFFRFLFLNCF